MVLKTDKKHLIVELVTIGILFNIHLNILQLLLMMKKIITLLLI